MDNYICSDYTALIDELKKIDFRGFKGYDVWHSICIFIYRYMYSSSKKNMKRKTFKQHLKSYQKLKPYCKLLIRKSYTLNNIELVKDKNVLFFSDYYKYRKDMKELVDNVYSVLDNSQIVQPSIIREKKRNPKYVYLVYSWYQSIKHLNICDDLKYYIIEMISYSYMFKECIVRNKRWLISADSLLSLNDENYNENLLFQFFIQNKKPTATLQHGHFWNMKNGEDLIYYSHNFKELTADYFFAWGQYTCDLAIKDGISPDRLLPLGIPKYCKQLDKLPVRHEKKFGVLLNTPDMGQDLNVEIIKFAVHLSEKFGYDYYVKLHPNDKKEYYDNVDFGKGFLGFVEPMSVVDFCKIIDFSIVCASTVLFELLFFNKPAFRYRPEGEIDLFEGIDFAVFSNFQQLDKVFKEYTADETMFYKRYSQLSDYCCGKGNIAENYRQAVINLKKMKIKN